MYCCTLAFSNKELVFLKGSSPLPDLLSRFARAERKENVAVPLLK